MSVSTKESVPHGKSHDNVIADFRELITQNCFSKELAGLNVVGMDNFSISGYPKRKDEMFTYVDLTEVRNAKPRLRKEPSYTTREQVESLLLPSTMKSRIVFVDGVFLPHLSDLSGVRGQVEILPLGESFAKNQTLKDQILDRAISEKDPFANINSAFAIAGAYIKIHDGEKLNVPLEVLFFAADYKSSPLLTTPRFVLEVGIGAKAEIVFRQTKEFEPYFHSSVTDILAGKGSETKVYNLSLNRGAAWRFDKMNVNQSEASSVKMVSVSTGSRLARQSYDWKLDEPEAQMELLNLATLDGTAQNHVFAKVTHNAPGCNSNLIFKNIVNDEAKSSVDSCVTVAPGAKKSFSYQLINNLLLSDRGRADNKPSLMIHADDVKCSHGATVGQLDDETLFYFMSRGLSKSEAVRSLVNGFAREITGAITEPYAQAIVEESILQRG